MRVKFNGQFQRGGGLPAFSGYAYQRGYGLGGIFKGLMRYVMPLAKQAGKAVGKQALVTASEIAQDVVNDVDISEAIQNRGKAGVGKLIKKGAKAVRKGKKKNVQKGKGLGKRPRRKSINTGGFAKKQIKVKPSDIFSKNE
ncbi:MAG: hypothetical protein GY820_37740 [Gammaproteobacteria bacterium]|nr:hypothetical protein [Gammaproteobacteria bacterium]